MIDPTDMTDRSPTKGMRGIHQVADMHGTYYYLGYQGKQLEPGDHLDIAFPDDHVCYNCKLVGAINQELFAQVPFHRHIALVPLMGLFARFHEAESAAPKSPIDSKLYRLQYPGEILVLTREGLLYHGNDIEKARTILHEQNRKERGSVILVDPTASAIPRRAIRHSS